MDKLTFMKIAENYIKNVAFNVPFRLNSILGMDCSAYPGQWLYDEVKKGTFDTPDYKIKRVRKDYSDTYIKIAKQNQTK